MEEVLGCVNIDSVSKDLGGGLYIEEFCDCSIPVSAAVGSTWLFSGIEGAIEVTKGSNLRLLEGELSRVEGDSVTLEDPPGLNKIWLIVIPNVFEDLTMWVKSPSTLTKWSTAGARVFFQRGDLQSILQLV